MDANIHNVTKIISDKIIKRISDSNEVYFVRHIIIQTETREELRITLFSETKERLKVNQDERI